MKNLKVFYILFLLFLISPNVLASWRAPVEITQENQKKYGINAKVYPNKNNPDDYTLEIEKFSNKCYWVATEGKANAEFGRYYNEKMNLFLCKN